MGGTAGDEPRRSYAGDEDRLIYLSAWLHYQRGKTQKEIARLLGVKNPSSVSRWLDKAAATGVVEIRLRPPRLEDLSVRLRQAFGLSQALVIPTLPRGAMPGGGPGLGGELADLLQADELGAAAARHLGPMIKGNTGVGLGGGRSLAAFVRHLPTQVAHVGFRLYALGTTSREPLEFSAPGVTTLACSLISAHFLQQATRAGTVPLRVEARALRLPPGGDSRKVLERAAERYYDEAMADVGICVSGLGSLRSDWVVPADEIAWLKTQGAVGEILYDVYGDRGQRIQPRESASDPVFPFGIWRLQRLVAEGRQVVVVTSGKGKALAHALMCAEPFLTGVVTDEETAKEVLRVTERDGPR